MSPFRGDVLAAGLLLSLPVLLLGARGGLPWDEVATRVLWCLLAGWVAVTMLRWAATPTRRPGPATPESPPEPPPAPAAADADDR